MADDLAVALGACERACPVLAGRFGGAFPFFDGERARFFECDVLEPEAVRRAGLRILALVAAPAVAPRAPLVALVSSLPAALGVCAAFPRRPMA